MIWYFCFMVGHLSYFTTSYPSILSAVCCQQPDSECGVFRKMVFGLAKSPSVVYFKKTGLSPAAPCCRHEVPFPQKKPDFLRVYSAEEIRIIHIDPVLY
jgi:hypothetical protein